MTDYKYDVFISYERDGGTVRWLLDQFLPAFRNWLRLAIIDVCGREPTKMFFDKADTQIIPDNDLKLQLEGIPGHALWRDELHAAIRASRCLVGIWNPPYFYSQ